MNKCKTYIVYVCHINTTSSKHLSDLIVKKIPQALELFVFFPYSITVSNLLYSHAVLNHVLFYLVQQRKKNGYCLRRSSLLCYLHFLKEIAVGDDL